MEDMVGTVRRARSGARMRSRVLVPLGMALSLAAGTAAPASAALREDFCLLDPVVKTTIGGDVVSIHVRLAVPASERGEVDQVATRDSVSVLSASPGTAGDGTWEVEVQATVRTRRAASFEVRMSLAYPRQGIVSEWVDGTAGQPMSQTIRIRAR